MGWSEDKLHRWLERRRGQAGDDAVALRRAAGRVVVCVDQVVSGVHFEAKTPTRSVGAKAAARALSDLAASAARPRALFAAVAAPTDESDGRLRALLGAIDDQARRFGATLAGGDLAQTAGPLTVAVTAIGELPAGRRLPSRDRAKAGHVLLATGAFGGSRAGRHLKIEPRIAAGLALGAAGAHALIDVSDGLARDVGRIARAAGARAELQDVPIHADARRAARTSGRAALDHALFDGEDHELVAAMSSRAANKLLAEWRVDVPLTRVGRLVPGRGVTVDGRRLRDVGGWAHGGGKGKRNG